MALSSVSDIVMTAAITAMLAGRADDDEPPVDLMSFAREVQEQKSREARKAAARAAPKSS